ncbi:MAG: 2-iminoacetate synthase ThiH [Bacillota bacterium]
MGFYEEYTKVKDLSYREYFDSITEKNIEEIIGKDRIDQWDFLALLSPTASKYLETVAQRAHQLSQQHFGRTILLYTPMYLSNFCVNRCVYCSFNTDNKIGRKKLTMEEIEQEAKVIAASGLKHILILTGESRAKTPVSYIAEAVGVLRKYFDAISIEIYPLKEEEYRQVIEAGVDGLTIYQEVYHEATYDRLHLSGPKKDYHFRVDAPEWACRAGIRSVNVGALLGLYDWRQEAFVTGLHANYLQNKYTDVEVSVSLPRIRPHIGGFSDIYSVEDKDLVQIMLALRLFLPRAGITISTRERQGLRDHLIPLGVTKMSAGVSTEVGGHSSDTKSESQFEISDTRNVNEIRQAILSKGYQPIFKDWMEV